jgi:hypothetical protein
LGMELDNDVNSIVKFWVCLWGIFEARPNGSSSLGFL